MSQFFSRCFSPSRSVGPPTLLALGCFAPRVCATPVRLTLDCTHVWVGGAQEVAALQHELEEQRRKLAQEQQASQRAQHLIRQQVCFAGPRPVTRTPKPRP
eukprot:3145085-Rhodomonas_salina.1